MNIVQKIFKIIRSVIGFFKEPKALGYLYIVASVTQSMWLYLIYANPGMIHIAAEVPILWPVFIIWVGMVWCILHLFYIGNLLTVLGHKKSITKIPNWHAENRLSNTIALLLLGVVIDVILMPLIVNGVVDTGALVLLSGMMGGRVLQANSEAIFAYHGT